MSRKSQKVSTFNVPYPTYPNGKVLYDILPILSIIPFARFRYAEPSVSVFGETSWLIEYDCIFHHTGTKSVVGMLEKFKTTFLSKVKCELVDIRYNMRDRITVYCNPCRQVRSTCTSTTTVRPKPSFPLQPFVKSTSNDPDPIRSESVSIQKECEREAGSLVTKPNKIKLNERLEPSTSAESAPSVCVSLPNSEQQLISSTTVKSGDAISSGVQVPPVHKEIVTAKPSFNAVPPPVVRMTQDSRQYALTRFRSDQVFDNARLYISYLSTEPVTTVFRGKTKLTVGAKLLSEGLPLGAKLTKLYYDYLEQYGITPDEIKQDLESMRANCRAQRIQAIVSAQDSVRKLHGLKGGVVNAIRSPASIVSKQDYYGTRTYVELDGVEFATIA